MSAASPLACSVVIPTYNAEAVLGDQLSALARQTFSGTFEVVVADNGSTDRSAAVAESWRDRLPHLRVVDASRARGVSAARNDGIRAAATDVILVCDADDVADDAWVESMLRGLAGAAFVGGAVDIRSINPAEIQAWTPLPPVTETLPEVWGGRTYAFGGNLGFRREVFDAVDGGFDEAYAAGAEEIDFAWRARDRGYEVAFVPDAVTNYRLRELRGAVRQQYNSGLGTAHLYAKFRPAEALGRSWHRQLRHEAALLRGFPWRGGARNRGIWLATAAFEAGKVRGAIRYRCPVP